MVIVKRARWYSVKTGVRTSSVIEIDVVPNRCSGLSHRIIGLEVDLLILDGSPEAFYEDIVSPTPFAIHADTDVVLLEFFGKGLAGELTTLIGIEDLRCSIAPNGLIYCLQTETGIHGVGESPREDFTAIPVHYSGQIDKSSGHRDVGDIHCPHLIGPIDLQMTKQIGVDLMARVLLAGIGFAVECLNAHLLHQGGDMLPTNLLTIQLEEISEHPGTCKR